MCEVLFKISTRWRGRAVRLALCALSLLTAACMRVGFDTVAAAGGSDGSTARDGGTLPSAPSGRQAAFRQRISLGPKRVRGTLTDVPLCVELTSAHLGAQAAKDGSDIFFATSDGRALPYEIERYEGSTGHLIAWIKLERVTAEGTLRFYLYYGGGHAIAAPPGVWTNGYRRVWHFARAAPRDAVTRAGVEAEGASPPQLAAAGKVGPSHRFGGPATSWISGKVPAMTDNEPFTLSAWVYPETTGNRWIGLVTRNRANAAYEDWIGLWIAPSGKVSFGWGWKPPRNGNLSTDQVASARTWHHLVAVFDGRKLSGYVDGQLVGAKENSYQSLRDPLLFGTDGDNGNYFDGKLDEVRLSQVARSSAWIEAQHRNQRDPGAFFSFATPEAVR